MTWASTSLRSQKKKKDQSKLKITWQKLFNRDKGKQTQRNLIKPIKTALWKGQQNW